MAYKKKITSKKKTTKKKGKQVAFGGLLGRAERGLKGRKSRLEKAIAKGTGKA